MIHGISTPPGPRGNPWSPGCIRDPSERDPLLRHFGCGGVACNEIERPTLGFIEQAAQIFTKNAQEEKLESAKHQHDRHQGWVAPYWITEQ